MVTSSVFYAIILYCVTQIYFKGAIPMSNSNANLDFIVAELEDKLTALGFEKNTEETADDLIGKYESEKGAVSIRYAEGKFTVSPIIFSFSVSGSNCNLPKRNNLIQIELAIHFASSIP